MNDPDALRKELRLAVNDLRTYDQLAEDGTILGDGGAVITVVREIARCIVRLRKLGEPPPDIDLGNISDDILQYCCTQPVTKPAAMRILELRRQVRWKHSLLQKWGSHRKLPNVRTSRK